ncbi:hypothetical protein E2C01_066382 [Portunus trituberculatus]|uniref:Uncharacterized protein n=1 Tax=Portunus trituberculatus TaxID=210409 RepID=A0A5B7HQS5_PORTR|nr:hypothetical protein [Portunus trituberculatus]
MIPITSLTHYTNNLIQHPTHRCPGTLWYTPRCPGTLLAVSTLLVPPTNTYSNILQTGTLLAASTSVCPSQKHSQQHPRHWYTPCCLYTVSPSQQHQHFYPPS